MAKQRKAPKQAPKKSSNQDHDVSVRCGGGPRHARGDCRVPHGRIETNDPFYVAKAIGTVARARGMSDIARESGLSRENLYRSLNGETKTELDTIFTCVYALAIRLNSRPRQT